MKNITETNNALVLRTSASKDPKIYEAAMELLGVLFEERAIAVHKESL